MNKREKHKKKPGQVISQRPLFNKINNQWRDNKTYDFIKEYLKKLKKKLQYMVIK